MGLLFVSLNVDFAQSPIEKQSARPYGIHTVLRGIAVGGIAVSDAGDVYVTDTFRSRIHRIDKSGNATVVAGVGTSEIYLYAHFKGPIPRHFSGDGGAALEAHFDGPHGIVVDSKGNIYVADSWSNRIRRVSVDGIVQTIAGTAQGGFYGDGGPATRARFSIPMGLAMDAEGNLFVGDSGNNRVRRINADGIVTTVAGTGKRGSSGDGKIATKAKLAAPHGVSIDTGGNLYIADFGNDRVRKVDKAGVIHTIAGGLNYALNGIGELVSPSQLLLPADTAVVNDGVVSIGDTVGALRILPGGSIQLIAGNGKPGSVVAESERRNRQPRVGEGDLATTISVSSNSLAVTPDGRIYLSDAAGLRVLTPVQ